MSPDELGIFFQQFQDFLAPKLDTYEQAIYLYIFRHTRFIGLSEAVIGFKSARARMACGIGEANKPMSENSVYTRIASLQNKRCISVLQTEHKGRRIQLYLPCEIEGVVLEADSSTAGIDIEGFDFFCRSRRTASNFEKGKSALFLYTQEN